LIVALAAALTSARGEPVEPRARPSTGSERAFDSGLVPFAIIVSGAMAWLWWMAWPHLLPVGRGSDLTHHLLLIGYIDRTGRLVHDRTLAPYLGEMIDYPPGAHLLAVLAGRGTGTRGLHA